MATMAKTRLPKPWAADCKQANRRLAEWACSIGGSATKGDLIGYRWGRYTGWNRLLMAECEGPPSKTVETWHNWECRIDTIAGPLRVRFVEDWIAAKFEDPDKARTIVGCNRYSGKWNHHGHNAAEALDSFIQGATQLLLKGTTTP